MFATRTSCHLFQSNQLRMLLAALGYVLIERLRALALQGKVLRALAEALHSISLASQDSGSTREGMGLYARAALAAAKEQA